MVILWHYIKIAEDYAAVDFRREPIQSVLRLLALAMLAIVLTVAMLPLTYLQSSRDKRLEQRAPKEYRKLYIVR